MSLEIFLLEVLKNLLEGLCTLLLLESLLGDIVGGLIALLVHLLAEGLVIYLVIILALHVLAQLLRKLSLEFAHGLDGIHRSLEGTQQILLADLLHLTLYHHDVLSRSTNHDVHIGLLHLLEGRINHILTVDTCNADFRNRALERYIRASQRCRGSKTGKSIGLVNTIGTEQHHIYEYFCVIVAGEQRTEHTVHQS